MKKVLSLLSIFSLSFVKTVNLISCENIANNRAHLSPNLENVLKVNSETNIDLEKIYLPHPVLIPFIERIYKISFILCRENRI